MGIQGKRLQAGWRGATSSRYCSVKTRLPWPPASRGNPPGPALVGARARSIPAPTGEPESIRSNRPLSKVCRRAYGGTRLRGDHGQGQRGLSPRLRGFLGRVHSVPSPVWLIPGCAGVPEDHGEKYIPLEALPCAHGVPRPLWVIDLKSWVPRRAGGDTGAASVSRSISTDPSTRS